jgi:hypothetical protein
VVRVGHTTLALRRREVESVWVELHHPGANASPLEGRGTASERVELHHPGSGALPREALDSASQGVELHRRHAPEAP